MTMSYTYDPSREDRVMKNISSYMTNCQVVADREESGYTDNGMGSPTYGKHIATTLHYPNTITCVREDHMHAEKKSRLEIVRLPGDEKAAFRKFKFTRTKEGQVIYSVTGRCEAMHGVTE